MFKKTLSLSVCCFLLSGCASNVGQNIGKIGGTTIGATGGALLGNKIAGRNGAIIGGLIGGLVGYAIGDSIDKRREELKRIAEQEKMEIYFSDITSDDINDKQSSHKTSNSSMNKQDNTSQREGDRVIITETNQFDKGSSELTPKAQESFSKIAKTYSNIDKKILIIGHTDDSGSSLSNQKLSEERAKRLGNIFAENGVKQENIYFLGSGETQPVADNNTKDGAAKNRRVEIVTLASEKEIASYANLRKTNPSFFKPVETKTTSIRSTQKQNTTLQEQSTQNFVSNKNFIDFGGTKNKSDNLYNLDKFGEVLVKNSFIGIGTKAKADESMNIYGNCTIDKPRVYGETKSLKSGEKIEYKTHEYKNGLNQSSWTTLANKHLIGLAPIGVLKDGSKPVSSPKIYIYKNYIQNSHAKPDKTLATTINTYQGTRGLLYRVFIHDDASLKCMDIIFDENNINKSTGRLYYTTNYGTYQKDLSMQEVGRN